MTPTLVGRIQTRWFLVLAVGVPWTAVVSLALPGASLGDVYAATFTAILLVAVLGVGWELIYHALQQFRWDKDWPTLLGLLTGINEGALIYLLLRAGVPIDVGPIDTTAFLVHFASVWTLVWLATNGPMRVVFIRWRFRGGRLI